MFYIWMGVAVVLSVFEVATVQLVTIWFALGAVVSAFISLCGVKSITIQIIVFTVVSLLSLIATRPLVKKLTNRTKHALNADRNIGKIGVVTEEINNDYAKGIVSLADMTWTARSENEGIVVPVGTKVEVKKIDGVKLIVTPVDKV